MQLLAGPPAALPCRRPGAFGFGRRRLVDGGRQACVPCRRGWRAFLPFSFSACSLSCGLFPFRQLRVGGEAGPAAAFRLRCAPARLQPAPPCRLRCCCPARHLPLSSSTDPASEPGARLAGGSISSFLVIRHHLFLPSSANTPFRHPPASLPSSSADLIGGSSEQGGEIPPPGMLCPAGSGGKGAITSTRDRPPCLLDSPVEPANDAKGGPPLAGFAGHAGG